MTTLPDTRNYLADPGTAAEFAAGLRAVAELVESLPDADLMPSIHFSLFWATTPEEMTAAGRAARKLGASVVKEYTDSTASVEMAFGPVTVRALAPRDVVCERVVVGTELVEVPDPDAPKVTVERDIVEWRCSG